MLCSVTIKKMETPFNQFPSESASNFYSPFTSVLISGYFHQSRPTDFRILTSDTSDIQPTGSSFAASA